MLKINNRFNKELVIDNDNFSIIIEGVQYCYYGDDYSVMVLEEVLINHKYFLIEEFGCVYLYNDTAKVFMTIYEDYHNNCLNISVFNDEGNTTVFVDVRVEKGGE